MASDAKAVNTAHDGDRPVPVIQITFGVPDDASPAITVRGVSLGQVMAAAWFLDVYARELRQGQLAQDQLGGILPPDALANVLAAIGRKSGGNGA